MPGMRQPRLPADCETCIGDPRAWRELLGDFRNSGKPHGKPCHCTSPEAARFIDRFCYDVREAMAAISFREVSRA